MRHMNKNRIRIIKSGIESKGKIVYWMSRDLRVNDNWALIYARLLSGKNQTGLSVVFTLVNNFLGATERQYHFMLEGLKEVEINLRKLNIPFYLLMGEPDEVLPKFLTKHKISSLVTDFEPLKIKRKWKKNIADKISIPFYEVDAHNIVPCLYVSQKEEFAAYTIRPKIQKLLPEFLDEFPIIEPVDENDLSNTELIEWDKIYNSLNIDRSVKKVNWLKPGESAAAEMLEKFLSEKIDRYDMDRNNPTLDGQSNLSPYLHFGQISAQRIALRVMENYTNSPGAKPFLEELIVRRELSDNFCFNNPNYDSFDGFKDWAKESLNKHANDKRDYIYNLDDFENAKTHEDLWNAAQLELTTTGKMHGYMRMYWAKKILEWSESPQEAMRITIYLNDKYQLDGRDPSGYVGCAWSIGGIHDRAWFERSVYGKIRYMNYNGCKKKFDVDGYIKKYLPDI